MSQENTNNGFTLPEPGAANDVASSSPSPGFSEEVVAVADTFMRDLAIGAGVMLVLAIIFFFMKNAYANSLVDSKKRLSPNKANSAGWWLYGFLMTTSFSVLLMIISPARFMLPEVMAGLAILPVITLVQTIRGSRN
ncbi:hypothetical protein [Endozoicomonas sp. SESOKO1]|uniref:hypothetical protein n=1 Tax=Endozoicomonas sp. SESOKO1 TaxID=2828742 RepID=UPI0021477B53|nr:hypothetical protein [Endozoicomonas sp. SESOKO1]